MLYALYSLIRNLINVLAYRNDEQSLTSLINKKAQLKYALKRYLITHSFYSVDEFLLFTNNPKYS
jgi:hypothetical protein